MGSCALALEPAQPADRRLPVYRRCSSTAIVDDGRAFRLPDLLAIWGLSCSLGHRVDATMVYTPAYVDLPAPADRAQVEAEFADTQSDLNEKQSSESEHTIRLPADFAWPPPIFVQPNPVAARTLHNSVARSVVDCPYAKQEQAEDAEEIR